MNTVTLRRKTFFKQVGCDDADIFEENYSFINLIGCMLMEHRTEQTVYAIRPESHEFLDFIDGRGFKVTRLSVHNYIVEVL